jgi:hypothetical protein
MNSLITGRHGVVVRVVVFGIFYGCALATTNMAALNSLQCIRDGYGIFVEMFTFQI